MSHFTNLTKANIVSPTAFKNACKRLGFKDTDIIDGGSISDYGSKSADVAVQVNCGKYSFGIQKNEKGQYDMKADWWGIRQCQLPEKFMNSLKDDNGEEDIQNCILKFTTMETIKDHYTNEGYSFEYVEDEEQNLKIHMEQYA